MIVHFVESLGGIHAVHAFRREPRNQEIFEHLDDRYRRANNWSGRLAGVYGPACQLVGRLTIALVLLVGAHRVLDGDMTVGVLAAFLLYLRQFFAPMEELSQFYNLFQAAAAATEKLSGVLAEAPSVPEPVKPTPLEHAHGEIRFAGVEFGYRERTVLHHLDLRDPRRPDARGGGSHRRRQDHHRPPRRPLLGPDRRRRAARRHRPARPHRGRPAPRRHHGHPGELPVRRVGGRQHPPRPAGRAASDEIEAAARAIGAHGFISRLPAGLRHRRPPEGCPPLSGPAAAGVVRPRLPRRPRRAHPRRGHLLARRPVGAARPARAADAARGPHRGDHRPPPHHRGDRRPGASSSTPAASSKTAPPQR